jgi:hypothetical protein
MRVRKFRPEDSVQVIMNQYDEKLKKYLKDKISTENA